MNKKWLTLKEVEEMYPGVFKIYLFLIEKRGVGISNHLQTHLIRFIKRNQTFVKEIEKKFKEFQENDSTHHFFKSKVVKASIKELQRELHTTYSQFLSTQDSKKEQMLNNSNSISDLLSIHKSTIERIESYDEIYSYIIKQFILSDNSLNFENNSQLSILDIGCGMNPLSIEKFINSYNYLINSSQKISANNIKWIGCDVHQEDMDYISKAYEMFNHNGEFFSYDVTRKDDREKIKSKKVDILFVFKVLDSLEHIQRNISFEILKELNYKIGVISFATYSLGRRKKIPITKRAWVLKFLEREKWTYSIYETENEAYIVYKKK